MNKILIRNPGSQEGLNRKIRNQERDSDIEDKAKRVAASESGNRASFNRPKTFGQAATGVANGKGFKNAGSLSNNLCVGKSMDNASDF
jgi:hypothetical protein